MLVRAFLPAAVAVLVLALAAATVQGASRLVVRGAGFGHGVGMSQYGAFGFAKQGRDHAFILGHYYAGTRLGRLAGASEVRVLLKSDDRIAFAHAASVAGERRLDPARTYNATRALGGAVTLRSAGGRVLGTYESPLTITGAPGGYELRGRAQNGLADGRYRGNLELRAAAIGGMSAINALGLEPYLRGVVASEMPAHWHDEALRAQAVAARTYAISTSKNGDGFDQYADTRSQVYRGIAAEHASTDAAVAATRGEIVVHDGKPIVTYYFSTSGGRTENVENSFIGAKPVPWLASVADPFDGEAPRHRWVRRMTLRSAQRRLGGLVRGRLVRIRVLSRGRSPRVVQAQIVGTGGRTRTSGPKLRSRLGLYATWARFTVITADATRGDADRPKPQPVPGSPAGGARLRSARPAAALARARAAITGRVDPAPPGRWVAVERRVGSRWVAQFDAPTATGGRYRANVRTAGLYRVRYDGAVGPSVLVR